jgi:hypothetical protein
VCDRRRAGHWPTRRRGKTRDLQTANQGEGKLRSPTQIHPESNLSISPHRTVPGSARALLPTARNGRGVAVQLQYTGRRFENLDGGVAVATLFQAQVVVRSDPASIAASSRRSSATRRSPCTLIPTSSGRTRSRRARRNSPRASNLFHAVHEECRIPASDRAAAMSSWTGGPLAPESPSCGSIPDLSPQFSGPSRRPRPYSSTTGLPQEPHMDGQHSMDGRLPGR